MAWLKCPHEHECGRKFRITTESGARYGTSTPYVKACPFCGGKMNDNDVINPE